MWRYKIARQTRVNIVFLLVFVEETSCAVKLLRRTTRGRRSQMSSHKKYHTILRPRTRFNKITFVVSSTLDDNSQSTTPEAANIKRLYLVTTAAAKCEAAPLEHTSAFT